MDSFKTYTCHHLPAYASRKHIIDQHRDIFNPHYRLITSGDPQNSSFEKFFDNQKKLSLESRKNFMDRIKNNLISNAILVQYKSHITSSQLWDKLVKRHCNFFDAGNCNWLAPRYLTAPEVSLCIKHRHIYSDLLASKFEYALILEDDAIPLLTSIKMKHEINKIIAHFKSSQFLFIDLSSSDFMSIKRFKDEGIAFDSGKLIAPFKVSSRTTCAYLINKNIAKSFCHLIPNPIAPIDYELTMVLETIKINNNAVDCFWHQAGLFQHGSQAELKSTIRS